MPRTAECSRPQSVVRASSSSRVSQRSALARYGASSRCRVDRATRVRTSSEGAASAACRVAVVALVRLLVVYPKHVVMRPSSAPRGRASSPSSYGWAARTIWQALHGRWSLEASRLASWSLATTARSETRTHRAVDGTRPRSASGVESLPPVCQSNPSRATARRSRRLAGTPRSPRCSPPTNGSMEIRSPRGAATRFDPPPEDEVRRGSDYD